MTQATLRIVKVFWGLDANLAYRRHFPAINWLQSYSLYLDRLDRWINDNVASDWNKLRRDTMALLQQEAELEEIVRLVGVDALSAEDRLILEAAKSVRRITCIRMLFTRWTYTSLNKQYRMLKIILSFYYLGKQALEKGADVDKVFDACQGKISRLKYVPEAEAR